MSFCCIFNSVTPKSGIFGGGGGVEYWGCCGAG